MNASHDVSAKVSLRLHNSFFLVYILVCDDDSNQKVMADITIRIATESDAFEVFMFKRRYFHTSEPLGQSHVNGPASGIGIEGVLRAIEFETVLMAFENKSMKLVGILIAYPTGADESKVLKRIAAETKEQQTVDTVNFIAYIDDKANICGRYNVDECLHINVLSVHPKYLGQRIGSRLFGELFTVGKLLNYEVIGVDCTSAYSAMIAEKMKMDCISTVTYDEYNSLIGKCLFKPDPKHLEIKTFAKRLT